MYGMGLSGRIDEYIHTHYPSAISVPLSDTSYNLEHISYQRIDTSKTISPYVSKHQSSYFTFCDMSF